MGSVVSGIADGVSAGAGLLGTMVGIRSNSYNAHLQEEQNALNRQWSTNERLAAQQYNTQERLATQDWNNPVHMAQMYRAAGVNPQISGSTMASAASSPQSSSVGSASGGISPVNAFNIPQLISSGADLVNAFNNAGVGKANIELMSEQAKYVIEQKLGQQIANDLQSLERDFRHAELPARITKSFEELANLRVQKSLALKQGKVFDEEAKLKQVETAVQRAIEKLKGEELVKAQFYNQRLDSIFRLEMAQGAANIRKANADAVFAGAQTKLANATTDREKLHAIADIIENGIKANQFKLSDLGLTSAELKNLQDSYYLDNLKDSKVSLYMDNLFHRLKDYIPNIPVGFVKGLK